MGVAMEYNEMIKQRFDMLTISELASIRREAVEMQDSRTIKKVDNEYNRREMYE